MFGRITLAAMLLSTTALAQTPPTPAGPIYHGEIGKPGGPAATDDDRFGDAVNVVALGADPTGVADASVAINTAIATGKTVLIPTGKFHARHMMTLPPGQQMVCMGRTVSQITVGPDFSPTDPAVVQIASAIDTGAAIHNCGVSFANSSLQPLRSNFLTLAQGCTVDVGTVAGSGCKYPPAILAPNSPRFWLDHIRISGAWDGVLAPGNSGGLWIDGLEVGALDIGLAWDGGADFCHVTGYHFWPFGFAGYTPVWADGSTDALNMGRCDQQVLTDITVSEGKINAFGAGIIDGLRLDGDHANLVVSANASPAAGPTVVQVSHWSSTKNTDPVSAVQVASGKLVATNGYLFGGQTGGAPMVSVTGGTAILDGLTAEPQALASSVLAVSGGSLIGRDVHIDPTVFYPGGAGANFTAPLVLQSGSGTLDLQGSKIVGKGAGSGIGVFVAADNPANVVAGNDLGGWGYVLQPGAVAGTYGPNKVKAFPLPVTPAFSAPGDSVLTVTTNDSYYWYGADGIHGSIRVVFNSNAFTTASGGLILAGLPFTIAPTSLPAADGINGQVTGYAGITLHSGESQLIAHVQNPATVIVPEQTGTAGPQLLDTASIKPSTTGIELDITFLIPTN